MIIIDKKTKRVFGMEITIAEVRLLQRAIQDRLHLLLSERQDVAYVEFEKGEDYEKPTKTIYDVTSEIERTRFHLRKTKELLATANQTFTFEWEGEVLTIGSGLELVKQLREESRYLEGFSVSKPIERKNGLYNSTTVYKKALFDPVQLKKVARDTLKRANRLSIAIDAANFNNKISVPFVGEYQ